MAEHNEIGKIGENLTRTFLMKQGFEIFGQNYHILQGELDIIAKKDNTLHFVEVKSIKVRNLDDVRGLTVRPEDNLTKEKWRKLILTLESYLQSHHVPRETKYQVDLACVYIDMEKREGRVRLMQNICME